MIAPDLQGHGRTADIDRPIDMALLADDIAALIDHLELDRPDVVGYSVGGGSGCTRRSGTLARSAGSSRSRPTSAGTPSTRRCWSSKVRRRASVLVRPIVLVGARRQRRRAAARLMATVRRVGDELVLAPVRQVGQRYEDAMSALSAATGETNRRG